MLIAEFVLLPAGLLLFAAGCWGLGSRIAGESFHSMRVLSGMTALLFFAGILNFLGIAFLPVLLCPLLYGCYVSFSAARDGFSSGRIQFGSWRKYWPSGLILLALFILLAATSAFPAAFNFHDDYQKYFIHPVKMLATGSFYGSPLSTIGKETLGGQAALQGVFVGIGGVRSINVFDAVFCVLLAACLLLETGHALGQKLLPPIAVALLLAIHPQTVNVSAIYSFVCFALGAVIIHLRLLRDVDRSLPALGAILLGALYASMIALKTTYALFPLSHFPVLIGTLLIAGFDLRRVARWGAVATLSGLIAILPWSLSILSMTLGAPQVDGPGIPLQPDMSKLSQLFSDLEMFYSGSALAYTGLIGGSLILLALRFSGRSTDRSWLAALAALVSLGAVVVYAVAFVGNSHHNFSTSFRYAVPFHIALIPITLIILAGAARKEPTAGGPADRACYWLAPVIGLGLVIIWLPTAWAFTRQSLDCGSRLAFSNITCKKYFLDYSSYVLKGEAERELRQLQELIPPGETIIAWLNYAHLLDFRRNRIIEVDTAGLSNAWARFPDANYMLVDVEGFATRGKQYLEQAVKTEGRYDSAIWRATLDFIQYLEARVRISETLERKQGIVVLKIIVPDNRDFKGSSTSSQVPPTDQETRLAQ